mmetsp:Transcript_10789/g.35447  ORF Transcript_10789/g.35447 Transcript_10789/m.35447 type:complete len:126 (+) Transcript_10789:367-744(+)
MRIRGSGNLSTDLGLGTDTRLGEEEGERLPFGDNVGGSAAVLCSPGGINVGCPPCHDVSVPSATSACTSSEISSSLDTGEVFPTGVDSTLAGADSGEADSNVAAVGGRDLGGFASLTVTDDDDAG